MSKISLEFKLNPSGIIDLSVMLNEAKKISENWSLNGMVLHVVSCNFAIISVYLLSKCRNIIFFNDRKRENDHDIIAR